MGIAAPVAAGQPGLWDEAHVRPLMGSGIGPNAASESDHEGKPFSYSERRAPVAALPAAPPRRPAAAAAAQCPVHEAVDRLASSAQAAGVDAEQILDLVRRQSRPNLVR